MGFKIENNIFYGDLPYDPLLTKVENQLLRVKAMNEQLRRNFSYLIGECRPQPFREWTPEEITAWKKTPEYQEYLKYKPAPRLGRPRDGKNN